MAASQALNLQLDGRQVEAVLDPADANAKGLAVIAHPHPLYGGTMDNKVVQTLSKARAFMTRVLVRPRTC